MPLREWTVVLEHPPIDNGVPPHAGALSLQLAVDRSLAYSPALKAAFLEVQARHGDELQAGVKPNPEIKLDIEDFLGTGAKSGFKGAEETLAVSQLIELGDKRIKRLRAASLDIAVADWDLETIRVQTALRTVQIFVDALAAQERLEVLRRSVSLSEKTKEAVAKRIKVGNTSPIELDRAGVNTARARAAVATEEARLAATKRRLAALWGSVNADFGQLVGKLGNGSEVPSAHRVSAYLDNNPAVARWSDEIGRRIAQLDVEVAKSVRDYTVGFGMRHAAESDSVAFVASVSTPLKIFDTNAGAITAAEQRIAKAEYEKQAARNSVAGSVAEAMSLLSVAAAQVRSLEHDVLPAAERAYEKTQAGYEQARFELLSVLDAQRTLFEVRLEIVSAKADYERAKVQVEVLIGRKLSEI